MLFNSYFFVLFFLPLAVAGYYAIARWTTAPVARLYLVGLSLVFYAWGNPSGLALLLVSILANFSVGQVLLKTRASQSLSRLVLAAGLLANLGLLGYYKYANFFIANWNALGGTELGALKVALPLGISFFTLQQMAFLIDTYEGITEERSLADYLAFTAFFPVLLSGPIIHHGDVLPQFREKDATRVNERNIACGLFVFAVGLFKKTVLADSLAALVAAGYDSHGALTLTDAWLSSFAFLLQAYFDFSGYSDMAVGIGLLLNLKLPLNFNSPYRATSIIQFWQRWHMTLTDFINAYIYMPLMRLRASFSFGYSLFVTVIAMTIVGLWHGASWNYILFGTLHGLALVTNHLWRRHARAKLPAFAGWLLTIFWWQLTLVVFRAADLAQARRMFDALFCGKPAWVGRASEDAFPWFSALPFALETLAMTALFAFLLYACARWKNVHEQREAFAPSLRHFLITLFCLVSSILMMNHVTEFIYFQF